MFTKTMNGTYLNIDCMELMAKLKDKEIDLAIVDPPYGINAGKGTQIAIDRIKWRKNSINKKIKTSDWDKSKPSKEYFNELFRVSKNQIIWGGNYFDLPPSQWVIWDKLNGESFFADGEMAWTSFKSKLRIFKYLMAGFLGDNTNRQERIHPTQKPVKLYEWLLTNYAKPNDLILDTHCGSASSLIACENLGFKYIASELDKDYYHQSLQRLQSHLAQGKLFQRLGRDEIKISHPSMFA